VSVGLAMFARAEQRRFGRTVGALPGVLVGLVSAQLLAGAVNVLLLAPVWLQLVHLLLADAVWVSLVLLGAAALDADALPRDAYQTSPSPIMASPIDTRSLPKGPG
jgi:heme A synthase